MSELTPTHYGTSEYVGTDGVKREVKIAKFDGDLIGLRFATFWDGEDKEPVNSEIVLGIEALVKTQIIITDFLLNIDNFKVEDEK